MSFPGTVGTVAKYETKTLLRNKIFYIYCLLSIMLFILSAFLLTRIWNVHSLPSFVPYMFVKNLLVLQAVFLVFFMTDAVVREWKTNSVDSIYSRSFRNAAYIAGKAYAVLRIFIVTLAVFLVFAAGYNLMYLKDTPLCLSCFIYYPLLMALPAFVFITGVTLFAATFFKSWFASVASVLFLLFGSLILIGSRAGYLFDFMCQTIPFTHSDFTGFGDLPLILAHRAVHLLAGLGFGAVSVFFMNRSAQSRTAARLSVVFAVAGFGSALVLSLFHLSAGYSGMNLRRDMISLQDSLTDMPQPTVTNCALDVTHSGGEIGVTADVTFTNATEQPMKTVYFALNPGLEVQSVKQNGRECTFDRNLHILSIEAPDGPIMPADVATLTIDYDGTIDERACYPEIDEKKRRINNMLFRYVIAKRYAFITPRFVLLTHESGWYPVATIRNGRGVKTALKKDFVTFSLNVRTDRDLTVISQGAHETDGNGQFSFTPDTPLPQISLVIGDYEKKSTIHEDIEYAIYVKKGHDYYSRYFADINDQVLHGMIDNIKRRFGFYHSCEYPFKRLLLVETPIHFFAYQKDWGFSTETLQPEEILCGEKGAFFSAGDLKSLHKSAARPRRNNVKLEPMSIQANMMHMFISSNFIDYERTRDTVFRGNTEYSWRNTDGRTLLPLLESNTSIVPLYYSHNVNVCSERMPLLSAIISMFLHTGKQNYTRYQEIIYQRHIPVATKALIELSNNSLKEIIDTRGRDRLAAEALKLKAKYFLTYCFTKHGIEREEFDAVLTAMLNEHTFSSINGDMFFSVLKDKLGVDLEAEFDNWYTRKIMPEYEVYDLYYTEAVENNKTVFQVRFVLHNKSDVDGVVHAFLSSRDGSGSHYIHINAHETKEVGIVMPGEPVWGMRIDPFVSKHFVYIDNYVDKKDVSVTEVFHGDRIVKLSAVPKSDDIIVDNLDDGFEISSQPSEAIITRVFAKFMPHDPDRSIMLNADNVPTRWTYGFNNLFYGEPIPSAHYIKPGKGDYHVTFHAEIPEDGEYNLYFYTPDHQRHLRRHFQNAGYNFIVHHGDETTETVLDVTDTHNAWINVNNNSLKGWTKIGTYHCSKGTASVVMTDESEALFVYADAIKWVKKSLDTAHNDSVGTNRLE